MRRSHLIASSLLLAAPLAELPAQIRWNDRPAVDWLQEAPRVRVWIDGPRFVHVGTALPLRVEVSDDAYVVVGKVDSWGQLQILFPYSRGQRNYMIAGGMPRLITPPFSPSGRSFVVNDQWGGFIFAIASYSPIDLTALENRDFRPTGVGFTPFTLANRQLRLHPQQYIGNFATHVLWDGAIPYDYDYDFYSGFVDWGGYGSALAFCGSSLNRHFLFGDSFYLPAGLSAYGGYRSLCGSYLNSLRCIGLTGYYSIGSCRVYRRPNQYAEGGPVVPGKPSPGTPNGMTIDGLSRTDTVKARTEARYASALKTPGGHKVLGDEPSEWDGVYSIPRRAVAKLKEKATGLDAAGTEIAEGEFDLSRFRRATADLTPPRREGGMDRAESSRRAFGSGDFESPSRVRRNTGDPARRDAPRLSTQPRRTSKPASSTVKPAKSAPSIKATRSPSSGTKASSGKSSTGKETKPPQP
jgi:hypothetical protein